MQLFDDVPEGSRVVSHSDVASYDRDNLWCLTEQLCRCQMHRVQCADRFDGKGAPDASEHCPVDVEDETAPLESSQSSNGRLFFPGGQPSSCARPDDRPASLCEGHCRRHELCSGRQRLQDCRVVLQERSDQRTRLQVANARRCSLWPTGARDCLPSRASARDATLRHDRCQSVQRRCRSAAGCPASPRMGHPLPLEDGECQPQ